MILLNKIRPDRYIPFNGQANGRIADGGVATFEGVIGEAAARAPLQRTPLFNRTFSKGRLAVFARFNLLDLMYCIAYIDLWKS
jgi:hypothetical protein